MTLRVLHLVGSAVSPFHVELSCLYARGCLAVVGGDARYEHHVAHVSPDRRWRFPAGLGPAAIAAAPAPAPADAIAHLVALAPDVAVPQMFCLPGMTEYRGLLDLLEIPYVGNAPGTMALAAHKQRARAVVAAAGVAVPEGEVVRRGGRPSLAPPVVVKPVDEDNSVGVALVREASECAGALDGALAHADEALVERYVELGREVRCGVLDRGDGELVALPLEEYAMDRDAKPIRGPGDKLRPAAGGEGLELVAKEASRAWIVPADDPVTRPVQELARRCHVALGCRDHSLFDVRVDPTGTPWFMEAGLYCSFSAQSVVAVMAAAAGIPTDELFASSLATVLDRAGAS